MKNNLQLVPILLFWVLSCSPKPPPVPVIPPEPAVPNWIDGKDEDSLYLYGVGKIKIGDSGKEKIEDLANYQISEIIKSRLKKRLQHISDSAGINAFRYMDQIIESRIRKSNDHIEAIEKYQGKNSEYALVRLDKKKFRNDLHKGKQNATNIAINLLDNIQNISVKNLKRISQAVDTIVIYLDFYPMLHDTTKNRKPIGVIDIARNLIQKFNDRIFIGFDPVFLKTMPLINDSKRINIYSKDRISDGKIPEVWIKASFSSSEDHDLILTKDDGTTTYQPKFISGNMASYGISFELDYNSMMTAPVAQLLNIKPNVFKLTVIPTAPKIYFENIIDNLYDNAPTSEVVNAIRKCFINKYSAVFVNKKKDSEIILRLEVSTLEHIERVSAIYPYFVHATGSISLIDVKTNVEIFNHEISEKEGSDFNSIEKAGINALKNLANEFGDDICD